MQHHGSLLTLQTSARGLKSSVSSGLALSKTRGSTTSTFSLCRLHWSFTIEISSSTPKSLTSPAPWQASLSSQSSSWMRSWILPTRSLRTHQFPSGNQTRWMLCSVRTHKSIIGAWQETKSCRCIKSLSRCSAYLSRSQNFFKMFTQSTWLALIRDASNTIR